MEIVVRDGKWFTIGDDGAQFFQYKKNDIIFNAAQTESLFKYGGIKGAKPRGKMLASGTAFAEGKAFPWSATGNTSNFASNRLNSSKKKTKTETKTETKEDSVTTTTTTSWNAQAKDSKFSSQRSSNSSSNSSSSSSKKKEEKDFKETFDWIEIAISRIERAIDNFDQKTNNIYKSWGKRNKSLLDQIEKVGEEIALQEKGAQRYLKEANSIGLSSAWAEKVRNGQIDISTIKDESLAEKIKDYQTYYEKYLDCVDAAEELKEQESELYAQRIEHAAAEYEGVLGVIEHEKNMLEEYISQSEAQGWLVSEKYYNALISNEKDNIQELTNQRDAMLSELQKGEEDGAIPKYTEGWYKAVQDIDAVTEAIEAGNTALLEYAQTIQELKWEQFDLLQDKISAITEEADFLIELMSNDKLYDDNGLLTNEGMSTIGLHGQNYNTYMYQADLVADEIKRLEKEMKSDKYDASLEEHYREMIALQQEYILNAEKEKDAIRDLVEEGIELELDALQERIDLYNEALESQKDLYNYSKKVKEQTEEIASLEKQMAAYAGDNSEEARQKIQQIKVDLESAREDLEQTEWDRYIENTEKMLDELYLNYEETLNMRLDNIDALLMDMIEQINVNADTISSTLSQSATDVGYTLSNDISTIWDTNSTKINSVITAYGDKFSAAQTTTNTALNNIKVSLNTMISQLNSIANTKAKTTSTSSASTPKVATTNNSNTNNNNKNNKNTSTGDGTPKEGDKVKFVSGQYYYDSYGKKPLGSKYQGKEVYITNINKKGSHPYHISTGSKLGSGDLGWLKLNQISGYAVGKQNFLNDEVAWTQENGREFIVRPSDGAILTPVAKGDSVLTTAASRNIWDMANSPADFIKNNLGVDSANIPNNSTVQSVSQNFDQIVFNMPNVKNYEQLLSEMQKDKNFERLILSMSVDRLAGKSSLAKGKSIR